MMRNRIKAMTAFIVEDVKSLMRGNTGIETWHVVTLIPFVAFFVAFYLTEVTLAELAAGFSRKIAYYVMRAGPLISFLLPPVATLLVVLVMPMHRRMTVTIAGLIAFAGVIVQYTSREYYRIGPAVEAGTITFDQALAYIDPVLIVGALIGFLVMAGAGRISMVVSDPVKRARRATFGDADWLPVNKATKLFPPDGGVVIGEAYRVDLDPVCDLPFDPADPLSWGKGGTQPLLTYRLDFDSTHMLFFAGSGGFKTTSNVVPTALRYNGPLICLDPSTEVAPMVTGHRKTELGRKCFVLDPKNPGTGFNVLDWIETSSQKEEDIVTIAHMLLSESARIETSTGSFFQNQAHNLLTGLLAHVVLSPEFKERRDLRTLRTLVSMPEDSVLKMLREVQKTSESLFIRETLGVFTNMTEQTFSGVYSTASKDTQWLSLDNYAALVCGRSFKSAEIIDGKKDIFLNLPSAILRSYPGIGRVIIGSLINAMIQADGNFSRRTLFMLDEVDLLGYMRVLEEARDRGRKYGVTLMLMYQSVGQLEQHFGRAGAASWIDGCAFASYAAIKSLDTARDLSAKCGEMTVEVEGSSRNVGWTSSSNGGTRKSESTSFQRRPLIMPHEITQSMRRDEQIVIVQGQSPLRCGRAIYFRRPDMNNAAKANRFVKKN